MVIGEGVWWGCDGTDKEVGVAVGVATFAAGNWVNLGSCKDERERESVCV